MYNLIFAADENVGGWLRRRQINVGLIDVDQA
jgi:hypothetical protein